MASEDVVLVRIRVSGPEDGVERVSQWINHGLKVLEESLDYPSWRDPGVRRYLTVVVAPDRSGAGRTA